MSAEKVILLLGRRDEPTDGVADYCEMLREAGLPRSLSFEPVQLPWAEHGWGPALAELRRAAAGWRDRWVLLQYTTLAWSRRGFPLRAPRLLEVLRQCGARPGVVFHDFLPLRGSGIVGNVREYCHLRVLRRLYARSDLAIFTVPLNKISWLPPRREKAVFIPVGANCPEAISAIRDVTPKIKTVAVYGITGGDRTLIEVADIAIALTRASQAAGPIRLLLFGRGSRETEPTLRSELAGLDVEIESLGLLSPVEVNQALASADVLLFVRGQISSRRGSAIAGIASGLPIVCYSGPETAWPITEAGILAVPLGDREALSGALETLVSDGPFRRTLAERSRLAHEKYFSWAAITERFAAALGGIPTEKEADVTKKPSDTIRVA
jgi:glycosyltransferase involved in cell wall biosynthesis